MIMNFISSSRVSVTGTELTERAEGVENYTVDPCRNFKDGNAVGDRR